MTTALSVDITTHMIKFKRGSGREPIFITLREKEKIEQMLDNGDEYIKVPRGESGADDVIFQRYEATGIDPISKEERASFSKAKVYTCLEGKIMYRVNMNGVDVSIDKYERVEYPSKEIKDVFFAYTDPETSKEVILSDSEVKKLQERFGY